MAGGANDLTRLLRELKDRSRRSYEELSRRALVSRSALHRYCTGKAVPPDAETVIRVTRACGATAEETRETLAAWLATQRPEQSGEEGPAPDAGRMDGPAPSEERGAGARGGADARAPGPEARLEHGARAQNAGRATGGADARADAGGRRLDRPAPEQGAGARAGDANVRTGCGGKARGEVRWLKGRRGVLAGIVVGLVGALVGIGLIRLAGSDDGPAKRGRAWQPVGRQWVAAWAVHPKPLDPAFFGVTINSDTGRMPSFNVDAVRLWDSGTRWSDLEPRRGAYDWDTLERQLEGSESAGLDTTFVLGGTPGWAAPDAPRTPYPDDSRAGPPDDLDDWDAFIRELTQHHGGRIDAYELWDNANDPRYYSGPLDRMVEMTSRAARLIRRADPDARIVCPSMTELWRRESVRAMDRFARLGGYRHCDVVSVKLHQRRAIDPPESTLPLLYTVQKTLHDRGVALPIWNTGVTYKIPYQAPLPAAQAVDYATRYYLAGLYGHYNGLRRAYFYNWGSTRIPIVLQGVGGPPTKAALAVQRLRRWLTGTRITACGQGRQIALPENVWQCEFRADDRRLVVRWTHTGTAATTVPPGVTVAHRMDGSTTGVRPGGTVTVTGRPVLLAPAD